jgi:hypothetical protein
MLEHLETEALYDEAAASPGAGRPRRGELK